MPRIQSARSKQKPSNSQLHAFFSDNVGIRGDLRYFRGLETEDDSIGEDILDEEFGLEDFDYWRATVGITFRFGG